MANQKNTDIVKNLRQKAAKASAVIIADYPGLSSNDINALRDTMKNADAELSISKNTLLKIALKEEKFDTSEVDKDLMGPVATIFSYGDPVKTIKSLYEFIKKMDLPKIKSAIFEGAYTSSAQVEQISKLPSKEQLLAQLVGSLKSPLSGIAGVLGGVQRKFVYAISALAEKKKGV